MGSDWEEFTFDDSSIEIHDGDRGKNYPKKAEFTESGHCLFLNTGNVTKTGFKFASTDFVSKERDELLKKGKLQREDVVLTTRGTVGNVAYFNKSIPYNDIRINSGMVILRCEKDNVLPQYLYLFLRSRLFGLQVEAFQSGSAQPQLPIRDIKRIKLKLPQISEQKAIAHILGSLDDKIELNRQMNETLESMAQALFKSWFVDFDPVIDNALVAGNPIPDVFAERAALRIPSPPAPLPKGEGSRIKSPLPSGEGLGEGEHAYAQLDKNSDEKEKPHKSGGVCFDSAQQPSFHSSQNSHQSLFPSEFEFTEEMGWIPKGWAISEIGKLCEKIQNGGTPRRNVSEFWENGKIPWLGSGEVRQTIITGAENKITDLGLSKSSAKWLPAGTTVIAMYGATAGQVAFLANKLTTNQAVCGLIPKEGFQYFNYLSLERAVSHFEGRATGSAQQNISKGIIEETKVIVPSNELVEKLRNECEGIFPKWVSNLDTNKTLAKLRDTLLPKLLSGELRIPDAEKLIKDAVV